jgi:hypothetical protein
MKQEQLKNNEYKEEGNAFWAIFFGILSVFLLVSLNILSIVFLVVSCFIDNTFVNVASWAIPIITIIWGIIDLVYGIIVCKENDFAIGVFLDGLFFLRYSFIPIIVIVLKIIEIA